MHDVTTLIQVQFRELAWFQPVKTIIGVWTCIKLRTALLGSSLLEPYLILLAFGCPYLLERIQLLLGLSVHFLDTKLTLLQQVHCPVFFCFFSSFQSKYLACLTRCGVVKMNGLFTVFIRRTVSPFESRLSLDSWILFDILYRAIDICIIECRLMNFWILPQKASVGSALFDWLALVLISIRTFYANLRSLVKVVWSFWNLDIKVWIGIFEYSCLFLIILSVMPNLITLGFKIKNWLFVTVVIGVCLQVAQVPAEFLSFLDSNLISP